MTPPAVADHVPGLPEFFDPGPTTPFVSESTPQWTGITMLGEAGWLERAVRRTIQLAGLTADWDSYGSPPPSPHTILKALELLREFERFDHVSAEPEVVPTSGGGVAFEWQFGSRTLELEVLPDASLEYLQVEHDEAASEGVVRTLREAAVLFAWLLRA